MKKLSLSKDLQMMQYDYFFLICFVVASTVLIIFINLELFPNNIRVSLAISVYRLVVYIRMSIFRPAQPSSPSWSSSSSSFRSSCFRIEGRFTTSPPASRGPPWGLLSGPPCARANLKEGRRFFVTDMMKMRKKACLKMAEQLWFNYKSS